MVRIARLQLQRGGLLAQLARKQWPVEAATRGGRITGATAGLSGGRSASFAEPLAQERLTPRPAQHDALLGINER
jgi:hypothetical protein